MRITYFSSRASGMARRMPNIVGLVVRRDIGMRAVIIWGGDTVLYSDVISIGST